MKKTPSPPESGCGTHIVIESVRPSVDGGKYPAKRTAGESCPIDAVIFRDGHDLVRAEVLWRKPGDKSCSSTPMTLVNRGLDEWRAEIPLAENARVLFAVRAWTDLYGSWLADLKKRVEGGAADVSNEVCEGVRLIAEAGRRAKGVDRNILDNAAAELKDAAKDPRLALETASRSVTVDLMALWEEKRDAVASRPELEITVDRPLARFGAWYELFVRSQGTAPGKSGTFRDAEARLPDIRDMGFDVVYLAPIHPIGRTGRKGRNNSLAAGPADPGSPWAIGNESGGHTAIEPSLGSMADFERFVKKTRALGMEVALDFALQCSPDHPWVKEHPEWFYRRPDGSVKYAENPPKKYEDIYPLNFDSGRPRALWEEVRRTLLFWIERGVTIFRVDNPHAKPLAFWQWLIRDIQTGHPEVFFLAEAFTRPPMMRALAKAGFSQSYTYFTWRNTKPELTGYLTELAGSGMAEYFRPNFFTNTPDILPPVLQTGGRPAFMARAALAATLSPSWGIYSGFELCENEAVPGKEEYLNSEKYEIKLRDWNGRGNVKDWIRRLNKIRRENLCLSRLDTLAFLETDNDQVLFYEKCLPDRSSPLWIAVSLDPSKKQECLLNPPKDPAGTDFTARELISETTHAWNGPCRFVIEPSRPALIFRAQRKPS